ncbi:MAG TPA: DNA-binding protein, partial [Candidatus Ozemobacteraceae bacterium]|nr:DNA-binding protein [Candidatus Ozemobacteraceae bacterium]
MLKEWYTAPELAEGLPGLTKSVTRINRRAAREGWKAQDRAGRGGGREYHISSLPPETRAALVKRAQGAALPAVISTPAPIAATSGSAVEIAEPDYRHLVPNSVETDSAAYDSAPDYARRKADKYLTILHACDGLFGADLIKFVETWNVEHPSMSTSYPAILRARKTKEATGASGLLARWGTREGKTRVDPKYFDFFARHYLQEGRSTLKSIWVQTLGYAIHETKNRTAQEIERDFPTVETFYRLLHKAFCKSTIDRARLGEEAWNRRHGSFVSRDYEALQAGEAWVSDHAQIDVMTKFDGKIVAP